MLSSLSIPDPAHVLSFPSPLHGLMEVKSTYDKMHIFRAYSFRCVKSTYNKMHIFRAYSFRCVNKRVHLWDYCCKQDVDLSTTHTFPCALQVIHTSLLLLLGCFLPLEMNVHFLEFHVNGILQYVCFFFLTLRDGCGGCQQLGHLHC